MYQQITKKKRRKIPFRRLRTLCYATSISLGGFLFGIFNNPGFGQAELVVIHLYDTNSAYQSYYEAAALLGAIFGALSGYYLVIFFTQVSKGRRFTLILSALWYAGACLLLILPIPFAPYFVFCKFLIGLSVGYLSFICPLFSMKFSVSQSTRFLPESNEASLQLSISYQSLQEYSIPNFSNIYSSRNKTVSKLLQFLEIGSKFQTQLIIYCGPLVVAAIIILLFLFYYNRQTPHYYLQRQNFFEVKQSLAFIYQDQSLDKRIDTFVEGERQNPNQLGTVIGAIETHRCKAFVAASSLLMLQVFTGINSVLLKLYQIDGKAQQYLFLVIGAVNIVSLFLFIFFLHRIARKILLVGGLLLMASCEASALCFSACQANYQYNYLLSCFFVFIFQFSIGPIAWIQVHEILEPKIAAIASSLNWLANFIVIVITLNTPNLDILTIVFSSVCFLGAFMVMSWYPETNLKSKREVHANLIQKRSMWKQTTFLSGSVIGSINTPTPDPSKSNRV